MLEADWTSAGIDLNEIINLIPESLKVNVQYSKWLDNIAYQYDNLQAAFERLRIENLQKPKVKGMWPAAALFEW
jgi:hypothetical protein